LLHVEHESKRSMCELMSKENGGSKGRDGGNERRNAGGEGAGVIEAQGHEAPGFK